MLVETLPGLGIKSTINFRPAVWPEAVLPWLEAVDLFKQSKMVLVPTPASPVFDFLCAWPKAAPPLRVLPEPRAEHNIVVWWMISVDCCLRVRVLNQGDCDVAAHGGGASAASSNKSYILVCSLTHVNGSGLRFSAIVTRRANSVITVGSLSSRRG